MRCPFIYLERAWSTANWDSVNLNKSRYIQVGKKLCFIMIALGGMLRANASRKISCNVITEVKRYVAKAIKKANYFMLCRIRTLKKDEPYLILVDGDNISKRSLKKVLECSLFNRNTIKLEIFCNRLSARNWANNDELVEAAYYLLPVTKQAADLRIKSRLIHILSTSKFYQYKRIYLATNDNTFERDLMSLAKVFAVGVISSNEKLLSLPISHSLTIPNAGDEVLTENQRHLIKRSMALTEVGDILKNNDISYSTQLTEFLRTNGYEVSQGVVAKVPATN